MYVLGTSENDCNLYKMIIYLKFHVLHVIFSSDIYNILSIKIFKGDDNLLYDVSVCFQNIADMFS